ncbi:MAG: 3-dehydroquinate synthase [Pseudohongiellaceae bacterium]
METLQVELADRSYPIFIGDSLPDPEATQPYFGLGKVVIVSNESVATHYLKTIKERLAEREILEIVLPDGEQYKNLDAISYIYDRLMEAKCDRKTTLVALGGGVVGDITGFAAATYLRGVNFVQVPTTLLAQVDSSVGGKTGVNHPAGKNMIGAFYQPQCVIINSTFLETLPVREVKAGLAEVIKYGLINRPEFFDWLAENSEGLLALDSALIRQAIKESCQAKAEIVAQDEREGGVRALLNLGHTFGHAIETASGYGVLLHGETVAMGMVMAADLSARMGELDHAAALRIRTVLEENFGMQVEPPADITVERFLTLMASDKKAELGQIRFILLKSIGGAYIEAEADSGLLEQTLTAGEKLCKLK